MMRANLAYIMSRFPGLSETFILREMNALNERGWQIALFPIIVQSDKIVHDGVETWMSKVYRIPWISLATILQNLRQLVDRPALYVSILARVIWENKESPNFLARAILIFPKAVFAASIMLKAGTEHIHAHYSTHPALMAWIIHKLTGISYSITVHAHDIFVRRAMLETKMKDASFIIAISEFNRDFLKHHLGDWILEKIHVVHCGIDPQLYSRPRSRPGHAPEKFNLISVGGLRPYKGMSYLVDACAILTARGLPICCTIVGDGPERTVLTEQIAKLQLGGVVELAGPKTQREVARLLADSDCYVQPSVVTPNGKMEGIPVALMEAMASKLPVIASHLSGIPELVMHEKTGYLVPERNAIALADAIEHMYLNPNEADKLASAGREHVHDAFNLESNIDQISLLFEKVTKGNKNG